MRAPSSDPEVDNGVIGLSKFRLFSPKKDGEDPWTFSGVKDKARRATAFDADPGKLDVTFLSGDLFSGVVNGDFESCVSDTGITDIYSPLFFI